MNDIAPNEVAPDPWKLELGQLYPEGRAVPDAELVNGLMQSMNLNIYRPSDRRRREQRLSPGALEGSFGRVSEWFVPPSRFSAQGNHLRNSDVQRDSWEHSADIVLEAAERTAFSAQGIGQLQQEFEGQGGLKRIFTGDAVSTHQQHLYFDIDPDHSGEIGDAESVETVKRFKEELKRRLREALLSILQNKEAMDAVARSTELYHQLLLKAVFEDVLGRMDFLRDQTERSEDREQLVDIIKQALVILGFKDLDVEALSTQDALFNGCQALYTPARGAQHAKISIPLSRYGTDEILEFDEILELVAHELAHHVLRNNSFRHPSRGDGHHHLAHSVMSEMMLQKLRRLEYHLPKQLGGGQFMVREPNPVALMVPPQPSPVSFLPAAQVPAIVRMMRHWLGIRG